MVKKSIIAALAVGEVVAGLVKSAIHGPKERHEHWRFRFLGAMVLLAVELGCNVAVGVFTIRRFESSGTITKAAFGTLLAADVMLWVMEAGLTIVIISSRYRDGTLLQFCRRTLLYGACIAPVVIPFIVGAIRSLLIGFPDCSESQRTESIVMIVVGVLFMSIVLFRPHKTSVYIRLPYAIFVVSVVCFSLGLWTAIRPERQIIISGLLVVLPPMATLLIGYAKEDTIDDLEIEAPRSARSEASSEGSTLPERIERYLEPKILPIIDKVREILRMPPLRLGTRKAICYAWRN